MVNHCAGLGRHARLVGERQHQILQQGHELLHGNRLGMQAGDLRDGPRGRVLHVDVGVHQRGHQQAHGLGHDGAHFVVVFGPLEDVPEGGNGRIPLAPVRLLHIAGDVGHHVVHDVVFHRRRDQVDAPGRSLGEVPLVAIAVLVLLLQSHQQGLDQVRSDFARMPKPILKKNDLVKIIKDNIRLLSEIDPSIKLNLMSDKSMILLESDKEQMSRVVFNLIKNSIESIQQKAQKTSNFDKIINIEIFERSNQIYIIITDNGLGFGNFSNNLNEILKPYVTSKKNGTGLGLSIVNKIINDHNGKLNFVSIANGAKIEIVFN